MKTQAYFTIYFALGYVVVLATSAKAALLDYMSQHPDATVDAALPGKFD